MTTFNTGNPIGSTDARDLSDNAENFDTALGTTASTWVDRLGVTRDSFEGRLAKGSFYRVGTFAAGYTLTNMRQTLEYSGHEYSWAGAFPKVVAASATPATSGDIGAGAWVDRTDVTLRSDLASESGSELVGYQPAGTGAVATTVQSKLRETVSVNDFGAVGDGVADDTAAILNAISFVKTNRGYRLIQNGGTFKFTTTLPFNDCDSVFSSSNEPLSFLFNCELVYAGTDKAVNLTGSGWGYSVYIETLTGAGVIAEGVEGGVEENIGLYFGPNSGSRAKVKTITGFNINTLFDGAYFNHAEVDYSFRCIYAIKFRKNPSLGYVANANTYIGLLAGGPYVAGGLTSDNNAKFGLHIEGGQSNIVSVGGIEYSVRTADGVNIYLDETSTNNIITCHTEGALQRNVIDYGIGNILNVDGVTSQSTSGVGVEQSGIGGKFGPIHKQQAPTQTTSFAPHQGQSEIIISHSSSIIGPIVIQDTPAGVHTSNNLVEDNPHPSAFARSDAVKTAVTAGVNYPKSINASPNELTYALTTATDDTVWFTTGPYSLEGATQRDLMFSAMMRGAVNNLKTSIFILDQSGNFIDSINTEFRGSTAWKQIKFPFKRGAATSVYYRIALRGFDGLSGGTIELFRPKITFDVASELHHSAAFGLPNKQTIKGNLLGEPISKMFADLNRIEVQQIISTEFPIYGRELLLFSSNAGGDTVNAFTQVMEGQEFTVVNISGSPLNISTSAMSIGSGLIIQNSYSMRFVKYAGSIYPVRT